MSLNDTSNDDIYNAICSAVTGSISDPLSLVSDELRREEELALVQKEIGSLYRECTLWGDMGASEIEAPYREVARDMILNPTDGRLHHFFKDKPAFMDKVQVNKAETLKHVEIAKRELKRMPPKCSLQKDKLNKMISEAGRQRTGALNSDKNILIKCVDSLDKFKNNFDGFQVSEDLIKNSKRDLDFEDNMKKIIEHVKDFQKVIDAKNVINTISDQQGKLGEDFEDHQVPGVHAEIISGLLKDVERLNYTESNTS